jgi:hypothetical protein
MPFLATADSPLVDPLAGEYPQQRRKLGLRVFSFLGDTE